jgi:hypothetical protein
MRGGERLTVAYEDVEAFAMDCLRAEGAAGEDALITARFLTRTDAFGIHSHGLKNLGGYLEKARRGALDLRLRQLRRLGCGRWHHQDPDLPSGPPLALLDQAETTLSSSAPGALRPD